ATYAAAPGRKPRHGQRRAGQESSTTVRSELAGGGDHPHPLRRDRHPAVLRQRHVHRRAGGRYFVAGKPSGHSVISGAIRLGRDVGTRQRILRELSQTWTRLTGQPEGELLLSL